MKYRAQTKTAASLRTRKSLIVLLLAFAPASVFAAVTFSGLDDTLERNARALMALAASPCDAPHWRVEKLYRDAEKQLKDALEAMGYYRFSAARSLSFDDPDCWAAAFDVELGEPVRLRNVVVAITGEANDDLEFLSQVELSKPTPGSVLDHGTYERYKKLILSHLNTRGYFSAELSTSRVSVDETLEFADMEINVESGARFVFGDLRFSSGILRPELLRGYADFQKGDPFDASAIARLHEKMNGSGFFASVSILAEPAEGTVKEVPVIVTMTPAKRRVYTIGAGFATDTGVQGRLGYMNRRRNKSGHQFDARLFLSDVDSNVTGTYRWPRGRPDAEWVDIYGGFQRKRTDTSRSDKTTLGIRVSRNRTEDWLETPYIDFTSEDFIVGEQLDSSRLIIPGIKWESVIGRDVTRVGSGRRQSLDLRGAHDKLFSDTTFAQATASAKWITTFGSATRVHARIDLGTTVKRDLVELPATDRFFAGGDTSVRGYGFETIGPEDDEGNVTGGANLLALSIEADWLVFGNWAVAAFVDSGSAFNDTDIEMKTGLGLGLRWYSPLGPIRVDVAHPLDDPSRDFRLHITLGPDL